ncbi:MAG: oligosaccharide flippase family protein [Paraburkholderia sp.]|uniref:oligosaccharide flippase family protein n=1 Tax=Burkholderiaceae TaxID=119060 RepID=UPI0010F88DD6|nr:oligosaccharide flippase family protein [Burkholderia sp. 4M9327F10]
MNQIKSSSSRVELFAVYVAYAFRYLYPLLLLPYYGRVLGADGYGVVLAGMSLSNSIWLFVNYGFSTVGARDTVHASDRDGRAAILRSHFSARLLLCLPALILGCVAIAASHIFSSRLPVGIAVIMLGLGAAFNLGWYFTGSGRARISVIIEVIGFGVSLVLIFGFIHRPSDLNRVFLMLLISCLIQLSLAYWTVRGEFSGLLSGLSQALDLIKKSTVIFVYGGTSTLLIGASTYLLSILASASEVSAFGVAERLIAAALSLMAPAAQILVPRVTRLVVQDRMSANSMMRRIFMLFFGCATMAMLVTIALSGWLVPLVFGQGFQRTVPVLRLLAVILPISVCTQVLAMYFLIPRKREALLARAGVISALVNIALAVPLASHWGALGMASARLVGELTLLLVLLAGMRRANLLHELFDMERMQMATNEFGENWRTD